MNTAIKFSFFDSIQFQMSHLYSMFAKDVSKYCKSNAGTAAITKCKHDLLTFGVTKLEKMEDSHLDAMDPFQRSANDISKYYIHCQFTKLKIKQLNINIHCMIVTMHRHTALANSKINSATRSFVTEHDRAHDLL